MTFQLPRQVVSESLCLCTSERFPAYVLKLFLDTLPEYKLSPVYLVTFCMGLMAELKISKVLRIV